MELKSLLLPEKAVSFEFPGCPGFKVKLNYLSKESNQAIFKKCQTTTIDRKTRQPVDHFDEDKFLELYVGAIIKDWSGFKTEYLEELVLADVPESEKGKEIDYTPENALDLMKASVIFDGWVSEVISDLGKFTTNKSKSNVKKSKATSGNQDQD